MIKASNGLASSSSAITKRKATKTTKKRGPVITLTSVDTFLRALGSDLREEVREMNIALREIEMVVREVQGVIDEPIEFETTLLRRT